MPASENRNTRWKNLLKVAWPLILANSFWNLQLTIDRVFLGTLSTEALGAAMAVMGVFWVPMALLQGTSNYVVTFVAQYFGANEKDKIGGAVWQATYVGFIGGVLFLGLNFFSDWFFGAVGHAENVRNFEVAYFNALAYSALPTALVAAFSGFFTGLGATQTVYKINLVGLVANAFLDYTLIFGNWGFPSLGVAGAGYATSIATALSAAYGAYLVFNQENELKYRILTDWKLKLDLVKQFLKYGLPSGAQWALEGLAFTVFLMIIGHFPNGEAVLAASSIAMTIMMLSVLPSMGIAQSVMTLVGQHLGNKNPESAELATKDGIKLLKIVALFTVLDSFYLNISFALKGAGDTKFVSLMAFLLPWPLMVLPTYLIRNQPDAIIRAWLFVAGYCLVTVLVMFWRFRQGKWKTMSVIH